MIDIVTIGTGGGSIAWRGADGALRVGPRSAGADPGPMCYGRGGTEPTITDAALVLGRIPPHLLGGEIPLDTDLAGAGHRRSWRRASGCPASASLRASWRSPPGARRTPSDRSASSAGWTCASTRW